MTSVFHKILRAVAGAMEIPDVVFLVLALGFAVFSVGWLICEYFTEHRHMREDLPRLLDALREQGADTAALIRKSQLNRRQKAALLELTEHPDFSSGLRESLAANLLEREQSHYDHILKCTELVSKLAPMLGLLGTLIPLGPGIIALGQGDTQTLSTSLLTVRRGCVPRCDHAAQALVQRLHGRPRDADGLRVRRGSGMKRRRRRGERFSEESVDPMNYVSNLSDAMLVLAVGMMLALIVHWNVDISTGGRSSENVGETVAAEGQGGRRTVVHAGGTGANGLYRGRDRRGHGKARRGLLRRRDRKILHYRKRKVRP